MIDPLAAWLVVFVLGACVGSFLNVCIHRLPHGQSVIRPPSRCPACRTPIRAADNIPVVSYLLLRGRCRACRAPIAGRYPIIELATALTALATFAAYGWSLSLAVSFAFLCALIVVSVIDLDHQIIPDAISLPGILIGFLLSLLPGAPSPVESLAGLLLGGGILWGVAEGYYRLTGREGMGGGDVKLLAMIGAFLGWRAIPVTLMIGSLVGSLVGAALILLRGRDARNPIPFGPFLAAGAACAVFFGDALIAWYLGLIVRPG
jgi:leader peptidase (prepilin peptidase)/N-methyltransferase